MRWRQGRRSEHVEDRRGRGGLGGLPRGLKLGGGATILVVVVGLLMGGDLTQLLGLTAGSESPPPAAGEPDEASEFVRVVLADTEDTWGDLFRQQMNRAYQEPTLVLFSSAVQSACGFTSAAVGPFYCPGDRQVYIDLSFFADLRDQFGAPGDFAQAYVIAHEVGHHVQKLLGTSDRVHQMRMRASPAESNQLSVRMELQADCYAGVWAHYADAHRQLLEEGDVEEGLNAAAAIGDDRLQRRSGGQITPESWTHGSSEQRVRWFRRGMDGGRVDLCDTFAAGAL